MENNQEIAFNNIQTYKNNGSVAATEKTVEDNSWQLLDLLCNQMQDVPIETFPYNGTRKRKCSSNLENEDIENEDEEDKKPYRLVIQIDKIRLKPGPRSEKLLQAKKIREKLLQDFTNLNSPYYIEQVTETESKEQITYMDTQEPDSNKDFTVQNDEKVYVDDSNVQNMNRMEDVNIKNLDNLQELTIEANPCERGCLLENTVLKGKPVLHCLQCNKYYMPKKTEYVSSRQPNHQCLICKRTFENAEVLTTHIKQHSTCGTCGIECVTKDNLERHKKLHVGRPPHFPYKCHLCTEVFRKEEHVRSHLTNKHYMMRWTTKYDKVTTESDNGIMETLIEVQHPLRRNVHRCIPCNITFRNEEAFGRHVNSHKAKEVMNSPVLEQVVQPWPTTAISSLPLTSPSLGQLRPVKFTCRICSQELASIAEIDAHTKSHMVTENQQAGHRCNVCDEVVSSEALLNEHVREHLAKAHRCPICSKAFINKTTLKNHLKTHRNTERT